MYERYIDELLAEYTGSAEDKRILSSNEEKRADWQISIGNYVFLVEAKAGLLPITIKQQMPDMKKLNEYLQTRVLKAVEQLNATEKEFALNACIKIVLLYEEYFEPHILKRETELNLGLTNGGSLWLLTINEFEMLLGVYKKDEALFNEIIQEKLNSEQDPQKTWLSIRSVLGRHGIRHNEHLDQTQFDPYREFINGMAKDHLPGGDLASENTL